jgi:UPF0755 protein
VGIVWPPGAGATSGAELLASSGVVQGALKTRILLWLGGAVVDVEPGDHLLGDALTPVEVLRRLGRLSSRARANVTLPEGFTQFQVAERLQSGGICSKQSFLAAASDARLLRELGVFGPSAEGYLFPATYELFTNARAATVVATLVREGKRRLSPLLAKHAAAMDRLEQEHGWSERDVLILASIVEREAAVPEEQPLIASVFFNRLRDPTFRPSRMLQSDPTALYGCLLSPHLASCDGGGRVTARMVRDRDNPYNTYRHPGLPPGPIANPGAAAIEAVLAPAQTDYLFFVARGRGRHAFSRTLAEHEAAIVGGRD